MTGKQEGKQEYPINGRFLASGPADDWGLSNIEQGIPNNGENFKACLSSWHTKSLLVVAGE
jgi:hypothetical protein